MLFYVYVCVWLLFLKYKQPSYGLSLKQYLKGCWYDPLQMQSDGMKKWLPVKNETKQKPNVGCSSFKQPSFNQSALVEIDILK